MCSQQHLSPPVVLRSDRPTPHQTRLIAGDLFLFRFERLPLPWTSLWRGPLFRWAYYTTLVVSISYGPSRLFVLTACAPYSVSSSASPPSESYRVAGDSVFA